MMISFEFLVILVLVTTAASSPLRGNDAHDLTTDDPSFAGVNDAHDLTIGDPSFAEVNEKMMKSSPCNIHKTCEDCSTEKPGKFTNKLKKEIIYAGCQFAYDERTSAKKCRMVVINEPLFTDSSLTELEFDRKKRFREMGWKQSNAISGAAHVQNRINNAVAEKKQLWKKAYEGHIKGYYPVYAGYFDNDKQSLDKNCEMRQETTEPVCLKWSSLNMYYFDHSPMAIFGVGFEYHEQNLEDEGNNYNQIVAHLDSLEIARMVSRPLTPKELAAISASALKNKDTSLNMRELKEELSNLGLSTDGSKAELVSRLADARRERLAEKIKGGEIKGGEI